MILGQWLCALTSCCVTNNIYNFEGRMQKDITDFTMRVGSSSNMLIATLRENIFIHAGPLRQKWLKPGVHTNDFAPIYGRRAKKLGHASLTTISPQSAHISADSPGESGVTALKVSANHNRGRY